MDVSEYLTVLKLPVKKRLSWINQFILTIYIVLSKYREFLYFVLDVFPLGKYEDGNIKNTTKKLRNIEISKSLRHNEIKYRSQKMPKVNNEMSEKMKIF